MTNETVGSNSSSSVQQLESGTVRGIKATFYMILLLMSVIGNSLVVVIVYKKKEMRTTMNYLIANMAVSDVLFPLVAIPLDLFWLVSGRNREWVLEGGIGEFCCTFLYSMIDVSVAVSILTMLVIAAERFRAVVLPLRSALIPEGRCAVVIAIIWLVSVILFSPNFYRFKLQVSQDVLICRTHWGSIDTKEGDRIMFMTFFVGLIILPLLVLSALYLQIFLALRKQNYALTRLGSATNCDRRRRKSQKLNSMLLAVVVVFFVTWIPLCVYYSLAVLYESVPVSPELLWVVFFLTRTNQAINPAVYYLFNKAYRDSFRQILGCRAKYQVPPENKSKTTNNTHICSMKMDVISKGENTRKI